MGKKARRRLSAFILKRDVPLKVLLQNMAYRIQVIRIKFQWYWRINMQMTLTIEFVKR